MTIHDTSWRFTQWQVTFDGMMLEVLIGGYGMLFDGWTWDCSTFFEYLLSAAPTGAEADVGEAGLETAQNCPSTSFYHLPMDIHGPCMTMLTMLNTLSRTHWIVVQEWCEGSAIDSDSRSLPYFALQIGASCDRHDVTIWFMMLWIVFWSWLLNSHTHVHARV